jgi:putative transposase
MDGDGTVQTAPSTWPRAKRSPSVCRLSLPAAIISHAVWLYFRFPLGLRMVEELLAARGIIVSHETVRQRALKFGQAFANLIRRSPAAGWRQVAPG